MVGIPTGLLRHYFPQSEQSRLQRECNPSFGTDEENKSRRYQHNKKRKNINTVNFGDLPEAARARIQGQVHQYEAGGGTSMALSITGPSTLYTSTLTAPERGGGNSVVFVIDAPCLAAGSPLKRMMPIPIQSNLPHIVLQFGPDLDMADHPQVRCAVDTCTALTTGNFHFFAAVAKRYPYCLPKLLTPEDYAPIVLSGIVQAQRCGNYGTQGQVPVPPTVFHFRRRLFVSTRSHRSQCLGEHDDWTSVH
jgi:hypothetical protein